MARKQGSRVRKVPLVEAQGSLDAVLETIRSTGQAVALTGAEGETLAVMVPPGTLIQWSAEGFGDAE